MLLLLRKGSAILVQHIRLLRIQLVAVRIGIELNVRILLLCEGSVDVVCDFSKDDVVFSVTEPTATVDPWHEETQVLRGRIPSGIIRRSIADTYLGKAMRENAVASLEDTKHLGFKLERR